MKTICPSFAAATGLVMMTTAASAQFFDRPRPPGDIPGYGQSQRIPAPRRATVTIEPLPPISQKKAIDAPPCDDSLRDRFCIPKPETVTDPRNLPEGQIVIADDEKFLYLSIGNGQAIRYKVATAVAREKMPRGHYILSTQRGERTPDGQTLTGMAKNPRWCPTDNIRMQRGLPEGYCMPGGHRENPFGGVALYLSYLDDSGREVQTLFRIHGTIQPDKIGDDVSSGCVRMFTPDANDLHDRVLDMRMRNIFIGIHVPQGPTREEYRQTQRAITARLQQKHADRYREPAFYPAPRRQQSGFGFLEQFFRF